MPSPLEAFAPQFKADPYSNLEAMVLKPFFTNLDASVYVPLIFAPELVGALCSLTSRAPQDLRHLFYHRYVKAFIDPIYEQTDTDESFAAKVAYGKELKDFIYFLEHHPIEKLYSHPAARAFYLKWLAQYGDDSIAQMAGCHLVYGGLSQVAIKHLQDQRIGLAPIEKSTRYVDYSQKVNGHYLYYVDPSLVQMGLDGEYRKAMDRLFETYTEMRQPLAAWLSEKFPDEKPDVIEKKVFDTLRGLLPTSTLSQVAFFGNGQAFEYMINRSKAHPLGEIRWAVIRAEEELNRIIPAFLRRLRDEEKKEMIAEYLSYLVGKRDKMAPLAYHYLRGSGAGLISPVASP
ncbi:MAG: FAD-dependent thymidylate synthase, partial [bacterium]|nr:FAD-dependent thymidylate synthase [bacterium]